jgi:hypothetical protein
MKKAFNYILVYILWIFDLGLALLLFLRFRTLILDLLIVFGDPTNWHYSKVINTVSQFMTILLGIGWLVFMIVVEEYFRTGVPKELLLKRFARVTAPVLLILFAIDLLLIFVQGVNKTGWLQWLALVVELGAGLGLLLFYKSPLPSKKLSEKT